ncbi:MAG: hypothetical protein FWE05_06800 [Defluviitaleaceae bacterium]|nr:hypothetical protein [Defluviitaleaceae bacterium]
MNFRRKSQRIVFITMLIVNYVYVFLFPVKADEELFGTDYLRLDFIIKTRLEWIFYSTSISSKSKPPPIPIVA